jgi:Holin of 3TMs, for gene-transfer release
MIMIMPDKEVGEELDIIARNDDHYDSMVNDEGFMGQVQQRNDQANQMMNLNNAALTQAGNNAAQNAEVLVKNDNEDWINKKWRPAMGWMYMAVCVADFIIFPVAWSVLQVVSKGSVTTPWQPITLQGAGLFHIAMGAVLGIAAFGRTQEKIQGAANIDTAVK